jgi:aromatic-L-amino-acid decarboxylase
MPDRRVVVCTEHTHSSIDKAARVLELELRRVPVDDAYRMRADLLDVSQACAIVATVGTTSTTSSDPVAEITRRKGAAWLHVDAAYAGSAWVCPELRTEDVSGADSLVVNPHKWLLTGMGCSCLWTARPEDFRRAFSLVPEYLRTTDEVSSLSEVSIPLGRPFRALRLWAVLRCFGRAGLQAQIREHVGLATLFEQWVRDAPGWELCAPRSLSVVCFRREGSDDENEALLARVNATGEIFISHTRLDGRYVLRLAIGNLRTTEDDVRRAWEVLRECAP